MTDGAGRIADLPWREVRQAGWRASEPVPLFEELLETSPRPAGTSTSRRSPPCVPLLDLIAPHGRLGPGVRRLVLRGPGGARPAAGRAPARDVVRHPRVLGLRLRSCGRAGRAAPLGAVCAQVPESQSGIRVVDRRFVRAAHARGLQVHVWTVNEPERMHRLLDLGVDGIMTDHVETLRTVLSERGAWA